ncbi:MAG: hypothetical protein KGL95_01950, partial [Patescibacteria group bacterium]|nr:hypothetical protein [Patescibacteria group bacterium]
LPYHIHEEIKGIRTDSNFLQRWITMAILKFNTEFLSDELRRLFYGADLRVYGIPEYHTPTVHELTVFLNGVVKYVEKLTVYRIRHVRGGDLYRQYSFAFLVSNSMSPLWVFFLKVGSPDSGGAKHDLDNIENLLVDVGKKIKLEINELDMDYNKLEWYLVENGMSFEKNLIQLLYERSIFDKVYFSESIFGKELFNAYQKMVTHYKNSDYRSALHELRPLIQDAMKITCQRKSVDISDLKNPNVSNMVSRLIEADLLDGANQKWVEAFAHEPNQSVHFIYPTEEDLMKEDVKDRIMLSFQIGVYLISSLQNILLTSEEYE